MVAVAMKMDLRKIHEILQTEEGRAHFRSRYPEEMEWYDRASKKSDRSMVQAVMMAMWQQEMERDAGKSVWESLA